MREQTNHWENNFRLGPEAGLKVREAGPMEGAKQTLPFLSIGPVSPMIVPPIVIFHIRSGCLRSEETKASALLFETILNVEQEMLQLSPGTL